MSDTPTPVVVTPKYFWSSWTINYNTVKTVLGVITLLYGFVLASQQNGTLPFVVDEKWMLWIGGIIGIIDGAAGIGLRVKTDAPVTGEKP